MKRYLLFVLFTLLIPVAVYSAAGVGVSSWTALVGDLADGDIFGFTDVSDTAQSDNGTSKKTTMATLKAYILAGGDTLAATAPLDLSSAGGYATYFIKTTGLGAKQMWARNVANDAWEAATIYAIDDTKGDGDTGYAWSADKIYDQLTLKRSISDEKKEVCWFITANDTATTVADGKQAFVTPASMNGMLLTDMTCAVHDLNSAASGATTVALQRVRGATAVDMTSTGVTINYDEYFASDETVDTANDDLATGDKVYPRVTAITTAAHKGLTCTAVFSNP